MKTKTKADRSLPDIVLQLFSQIKHVNADTAERRTLSQIIDDIKRGRYAPQIARVRAATGDERTELKKSLPYVSLSVTFKRGAKRSGKLEAIESFTGLMQIDLDHVQDVVAAIAQLMTLPYVIAAFRSPSGDGVKAIAWVKVANEREHLAAFATISRDVQQLTGEGMKQDAQTKDISRACFLSHDPDLWINPAPVQLTEFVKVVPEQRQTTRTAAEHRPGAMLAPAEITAAERLIFDRFTRGGQIADGRRHTLYQIGLACHDAGLADASAMALAERLNAAICLPPKDSREVAEQIFSAYRYARGPLGNRAADIARHIHRRQAQTLDAPNTHTICKQYISPDDLRTLSARVVLVESVQGTGKTECIKTLTAEAQAKGQRVVYIAHRVSLLRQAAQKLSLMFYKAAGRGMAQSIAITPNSLPAYLGDVLDEYKGAVVFIDEVDQVFKDICGKTCKAERQAILSAIYALLRNAGKVYGLSADITPTVHAVFSDIGFSPAVLRNTYRTARNATRYKTLPAIRAEMEKCITEGQPVAVASDSEKWAQAFHRSIEKKFPAKRCLLITAKNSQTETVQNLFQNTEAFAAYDVVIYSPAMGSGLDINLPFGDAQFLIAGGRSVQASELMQMATRFRQWKELHFYCTTARLKKPRTENPAEIIEAWKEREADYSSFFFQDMHDRQVKPLDGYGWCINLAARVQAEINMSRNDLYGCFADVLHGKGFTIREAGEADADAVAEIKERDKESRAELRAEYVAAVLDPANDISEHEAERIKKGGATRDGDSVKFDRFEYVQTIGTDDAETMAQAVQVSLGTRMKQVAAFATFKDDPAEIAKREADRSAVLPYDLRYDAAKARIRQAIESRLRLLSGEIASASPQGYSAADADALRSVIDEHAPQVTRYLFDVTDAMSEHPILFLRAFYGQAGVKLRSKAHGKARTRHYTADPDSVAFMQAIYERKNAARQSREAQRQAWLDPFANVPPTVLPELLRAG